MEKNNKRKSNIELLRIIMMFFIVFWHFLSHGSVIQKTTGVTNLILNFLVALINVHVNIFVLISGYFNYNKEFKLSKALHINNIMWFYSAFFVLLFSFLKIEHIANIDLIKFLSPISHFEYWFLTCYLLLYIFTPIINLCIRNMSKNLHKKFLIAYFFLLIFLPYITMGVFYDVNKGYSLYNFVFLYFLGAYLNKYKIEKTNMFINYTTKKIRVILIISYLFIGTFNFLLYNFSFNLGTINSRTLKYIASTIYDGFQAYNNPFIIVESVLLFSYFCLIEVKHNKVINYISKNILGCYLISENLFFKRHMYGVLKFNKINYSINIIPKTIFLSFVIVILFSIIESIRAKICNVLCSTKLFKKIKEIILNYIAEFNNKA